VRWHWRSAHHYDIDDDVVLCRDVDAMRGEGESHRHGRTVASDHADEALGPSSELARVLHAQADELAANGFRALAAWCDPALKTIAYLLGSTVTRDHRTIFAAASPGVDPRGLVRAGDRTRTRIVSLGTVQPSPDRSDDMRCTRRRVACSHLFRPGVWPVRGPDA
jgi:hypothetical protein